MNKAIGIALAILFFGTLWGASEAILGGALYSRHVPYASVPLTVIAVVVLTFAAVRVPIFGAAATIGVIAALYKLINVGPWWCHLCAIALFGVTFDVLRAAFRLERRSPWQAAAFGVAVTYLAYGTFAVLMTFVFHFPYWVGDWGKFVRYVGISGTMAAAINALAVPAALHVARRLRRRELAAAGPPPRLALGGMGALAAALWVVCLTVSV